MSALPEDLHDDFVAHGEHLSTLDRLVVSPSWGRVEPASLQRHDLVAAGTVVAHLTEAGESRPLVSPVAGAFIRWLVRPGERVPPGRPVALLRSQ